LKILLLTQVLPYPPDSGPKVKTYNVLRYLSQHYDITLVSFVRGNQVEHIEHLKRYCRSVYTVPMKRSMLMDVFYLGMSFVARQPFIIVRDSRRSMHNFINKLCLEKSFHFVLADQLNMAQYAHHVPDAFRILDEHNALWLLYKRIWDNMSGGLRKLVLGRDWQLLKSYEGSQIRKFSAVLSVSNADKTALSEAAGSGINIRVVPITVDTDTVTVVERKPEARNILHIGTMYWPPNIEAISWFAKKIYPIIKKYHPDVRFDVIGERPPHEILHLNDSNTGINVTGYVADLKEYQRNAAVFVVPLLAGSGMRVKILNSLAEGIPVVSTSQGCEGIDLIPGKDILIGDSAEEFAEQVIKILDDNALGEQLSLNGRELIKNRYAADIALRPLDDIFRKSNSAERTN
jgi:glycosyltransferase involved in cell wall biosynthesis